MSSDLLPSRSRSPAVAPTLIGVLAYTCATMLFREGATALLCAARPWELPEGTWSSSGTVCTAVFSSGSSDFAALSASESYELSPGFNCSKVSERKSSWPLIICRAPRRSHEQCNLVASHDMMLHVVLHDSQLLRSAASCTAYLKLVHVNAAASTASINDDGIAESIY